MSFRKVKNRQPLPPTPPTSPKKYSSECGELFMSWLREKLFIYETPKVVLIQSTTIGFIFRFIQVGILIYFIMWIMIKQRGYQRSDQAISGVTTEVRGLAWTDLDPSAVYYASGPRVWDNGDYSIPPQQNAGFFVVTRIAAMLEQKLDYCSETADLSDALCETDKDCQEGYTAHQIVNTTLRDIDIDLTGHGVFSGKCLNSTGTCEIFAWCPIYDKSTLDANWSKNKKHNKDPLFQRLEQEREDRRKFFQDLNVLNERHKDLKGPGPNDERSPPFYDALNFTVYIKNSIEFPIYSVKRRNILPDMNQSYLDTCQYNDEHPRDKYCPVLRLGYIIEKAGADYYRLLRYGGVISITIDWDCDLDYSEEYCLPKYGFKQLDSPPEIKEKVDSKAPLRPGEGWNIEYAYHYGHDNDNSGGRRRLLAVVNGIQFLVHSTGKAGRFHIIDFTMKFGSGLALFGSATIVCDLILFYLVRDRDRYRKAVCSDEPVKASSSHKLELLRHMSQRAMKRKSSSNASKNISNNIPLNIKTLKKKSFQSLSSLPKTGSFDNEEISDSSRWRLENLQIENLRLENLERQIPEVVFEDASSTASRNRFSQSNTEMAERILSQIDKNEPNLYRRQEATITMKDIAFENY